MKIQANVGRSPRGILAMGAAAGGHSPAEILASLTENFEAFRGRNDDRLERLEAGLDQVAASVAAHRLNGGSGAASGSGRQARAAFGSFAKTGDFSDVQRLSPQAAMREGSSPDGGFLVPDELSDVILSVQRNLSPMRRICRTIKTKSQTYSQPIGNQAASSGWVGEESARPATASPKLVMATFPTSEIYANVPVTQQLLDDSTLDLGSFVLGEISKEFDSQEGIAFVLGNGVGKPKGVLTYDLSSAGDASRAFGALQYIPTGAASTFASSDPADALINLVFALKAAHRQNARWLMNSVTMATVAKFKDLEGRYLLQPSLAAGSPTTLLGYPVEVDENMPDIAANASPIAFGDWQSGYLIVDRLDFTVLRDPYTAKPYVNFYVTKRVGGGLLDSNAIKVLKIATA